MTGLDSSHDDPQCCQYWPGEGHADDCPLVLRYFADLERRASAVSPQCGPVAPIDHTPLTVGGLRGVLAMLPDEAVIHVELPSGEAVTVTEAFLDEADFDGDSLLPQVELWVVGTRVGMYRRIADGA